MYVKSVWEDGDKYTHCLCIRMNFAHFIRLQLLMLNVIHWMQSYLDLHEYYAVHGFVNAFCTANRKCASKCCNFCITFERIPKKKSNFSRVYHSRFAITFLSFNRKFIEFCARNSFPTIQFKLMYSFWLSVHEWSRSLRTLYSLITIWEKIRENNFEGPFIFRCVDEPKLRSAYKGSVWSIILYVVGMGKLRIGKQHYVI